MGLTPGVRRMENGIWSKHPRILLEWHAVFENPRKKSGIFGPNRSFSFLRKSQRETLKKI